MQTTNVSEPVFSNGKGWFRYNYDQSRLEFLSNETKMIIQTWAIPIDQWESLTSKEDYCENIVNQVHKQRMVNQQKYQQQEQENQQKEKKTRFVSKLTLIAFLSGGYYLIFGGHYIFGIIGMICFIVSSIIAISN